MCCKDIGIINQSLRQELNSFILKSNLKKITKNQFKHIFNITLLIKLKENKTYQKNNFATGGTLTNLGIGRRCKLSYFIIYSNGDETQ